MSEGPAEVSPMINKWEANLQERRLITAFMRFLFGKDAEGTMLVNDLDLDELLDEYHGIDQQQLKHERRKMTQDCNG
jgi:hypothetical protein